MKRVQKKSKYRAVGAVGKKFRFGRTTKASVGQHLAMGRKLDYVEGHKETVAEYLDHGGLITVIDSPGVSRHLTDPKWLVHVAAGGRADDGDVTRGFGLLDLPSNLRGSIAEHNAYVIDGDDTETWETWETGK
jgi:hypothetical protein